MRHAVCAFLALQLPKAWLSGTKPTSPKSPYSYLHSHSLALSEVAGFQGFWLKPGQQRSQDPPQVLCWQSHCSLVGKRWMDCVTSGYRCKKEIFVLHGKKKHFSRFFFFPFLRARMEHGRCNCHCQIKPKHVTTKILHRASQRTTGYLEWTLLGGDPWKQGLINPWPILHGFLPTFCAKWPFKKKM